MSVPWYTSSRMSGPRGKAGHTMVRSSRPGEKVTMPVARRLAAIVAADVAGYSRLMGLDEAGPPKTPRKPPPAIDPFPAPFGGRAVKTPRHRRPPWLPSVGAAGQRPRG